MFLTSTQARYLLKLIAEKHGEGYADEDAKLDDGTSVGALQAKLSVMLQGASEAEERQRRASA